MEFLLGESTSEIHIDTVEEYKHAMLSMLEQAQHTIDIFTQDLEPEIYNNKRAEHALLRLAKKHHNTRIRLLVNDTSRAVQNGHCLVRLAQQLTSSVTMHTPSAHYKNEQGAFLVVDKTGLIIRPLATDRNYQASVTFKSLRAAAKRLELFDEIWEHSTPDIQTRRIHI